MSLYDYILAVAVYMMAVSILVTPPSLAIYYYRTKAWNRFKFALILWIVVYFPVIVGTILWAIFG